MHEPMVDVQVDKLGAGGRGGAHGDGCDGGDWARAVAPQRPALWDGARLVRWDDVRSAWIQLLYNCAAAGHCSALMSAYSPVHFGVCACDL